MNVSQTFYFAFSFSLIVLIDMSDEARLDYTAPPAPAIASPRQNKPKKSRREAVDAATTTTVGGGGGGRGGRDLRRAYYRKSLQWHPDRWAGMPALYLPAVQVRALPFPAPSPLLSFLTPTGCDPPLLVTPLA